MKVTTTLVLGIASLTGLAPVFANDVFQVVVEDNTITWGADTFGYMQVQDAGTWETLCEFTVYTLDTPSRTREGTVCSVDSGLYNVINHTTRQRIEGLNVGELDGTYTAPMVETIDGSWVYYDPFRVIDANTIYSPSATVPPPANLTAIVYSSTAAELFWDRADEPGLLYDAYVDSQLLGSTNGTSLFLSQLQAGETFEVMLVARNAAGSQSSASTVSFQTLDDGTPGSTPTELSAPTGLRASVYSANTLELFWDRQGPGQLFEVFGSDGESLVRTDGTSYFITNLPMDDEYRFSVRAVDNDSNSSAAASIVVSTNTPDPEPAISIGNAENLLKQVVAIANREPFQEAANLMAPGVSAVLLSAFSYFADDEPPINGLSLIEGTAGGRDTVNFAGLNGGQYVCDAGGSADALSVYGGETGEGYIVYLDECLLPAGQYSGKVTYSYGGRSGYVSNTYENLEITPEPNTATYQYDGNTSVVYNRYRGDTTDTSSANTYAVHLPDGEKLIEIVNFQSNFASQLTMNQGSFLDILYGEINADISFDVDLPALSASRYSVSIDLAYAYNDTASDPIGLWNSGSVLLTASDGSQLMATLVDTDGDSTYESLSIAVGDDQIVRPVSDGFLVSCRQESFEEC